MKKSATYLIPSLVLLATLLTSPSPATAATYVRMADADLADQAAVIVQVRVVAVEPAPGERPMTDYQVEVEDLIAGYLPASSIVVRTFGGRSADGMELYVPGTPRFTEGESALLFLVPRDDGTFDILHLMLGAFRITEVDGKRYAHRDLSEATEVVVDGREQLEPEQPRDPERFGAWLRDHVAGIERPADYRVEPPAGGLRAVPEKFSLLGGRWTVFDTGGSVRWRAHRSGQPGQSGGGFAQFQTALRAFTNHPTTPIRLTYGGTTSTSASLNRCDGNNVLLFDDPNNDITSAFSCLPRPSGVLGVARYCIRPGATSNHNGMRFDVITEADIVTNDGTACVYPGRKLAEELYTHELGHTLGLGHSSNRAANMWPFIHNDGRGSRLHNDDKNGLVKLYGDPPAAPSNLQVQARAGDIRLTWRDNSNDESRFQIQRRRGSGSFSTLLNVSANTTSWNDTGVTNGMYCYRVLAFNSAGDSAFSNVDCDTFGIPGPSNLTAVAQSQTEIQLTWVDNSTAETGFEIESQTGGGSFILIATAPADAQSATIASLAPETGYTFRVRAMTPGGPSSYSNSATATTWGDPCVCTSGPNTMCLDGDRFRVEADWRDPQGQIGDAEVVDFGSNNSGLFWFFSADNWEMLLKVLDGCGVTGHYWVFAAATTNVEYNLNVTDCWTGAPANYFNPLGTTAPAITDTRALATCGAAPPPGALAPAVQAAPPTVARDEVPGKQGNCVPSDTELCLVQDRFKVEVDWENHQGNFGSGMVVPTDSSNSGLLWFFNDFNWEMLIKVLDGCAINGHYWVFSAATTDVGYTLRVTDTDNGTVWETTNIRGNPAATVTDTTAFATCP